MKIFQFKDILYGLISISEYKATDYDCCRVYELDNADSQHRYWGRKMSLAKNVLWSPKCIVWNFKLTAGLNVSDLGNLHFRAFSLNWACDL